MPMRRRIITYTDNVTLDDTSHTVLCDASGGPFTVTLPLAAENTARLFYIKKIDTTANAITIQPSGSDKIDVFETSLQIFQFRDCYELHTDGVGWFII